THPGDLLASFVSCDVLHLIADVHMPVDTTFRPVGGIAAANLQEHANLVHAVGLLAEEVSEGALDVADELLWPMTLLARFLGRAQVGDGRGNGTWELVRERGIDLVGAGKLRAHVPGGSSADMAFRARHARMRTVLVSHPLGFHDRVT